MKLPELWSGSFTQKNFRRLDRDDRGWKDRSAVSCAIKMKKSIAANRKTGSAFDYKTKYRSSGMRHSVQCQLASDPRLRDVLCQKDTKNQIIGKSTTYDFNLSEASNSAFNVPELAKKETWQPMPHPFTPFKNSRSG